MNLQKQNLRMTSATEGRRQKDAERTRGGMVVYERSYVAQEAKMTVVAEVAQAAVGERRNVTGRDMDG